MNSANFNIYKNKDFEESENVESINNKSIELEIPFDDLSLKLANALKRNGIFDFTQLIGLEEKDYLLKVRNFGDKSFNELSHAFGNFGLKIPLTSDQLQRLFPNWKDTSETKKDAKDKFLEFKISS